jgi:hypothetical protein
VGHEVSGEMNLPGKKFVAVMDSDDLRLGTRVVVVAPHRKLVKDCWRTCAPSRAGWTGRDAARRNSQERT